jgi:flagellar basal body-associated protein FliL
MLKVLMAVTVTITVFWGVTPCSPVADNSVSETPISQTTRHHVLEAHNLHEEILTDWLQHENINKENRTNSISLEVSNQDTRTEKAAHFEKRGCVM